MGTHTFVVLELSKTAFEEIHSKMEEAGYAHAFNTGDGKVTIDMHGIAVAEEEGESAPRHEIVAKYLWEKYRSHGTMTEDNFRSVIKRVLETEVRVERYDAQGNKIQARTEERGESPS